MKRLLSIFIILLLLGSSTVGAFADSKAKIPNTNVYADSRIVDAFVELGFTVKYDKKMSYAGLFSVGKHAIILKNKAKDTTLHELGHFVSRLHGGADETKQFKKIYEIEKKKYNGKQKKYITKNSKEYFAQSFAEYSQNPSKLKKNRPKTYAYIKECVDTISQKHIDNTYKAYSWAW